MPDDIVRAAPSLCGTGGCPYLVVDGALASRSVEGPSLDSLVAALVRIPVWRRDRPLPLAPPPR